ncbi:MAG: Uma2 family endonuclease [Rivularia sp. (in: Bacteria)]|nr:Uma2 family endonuclease [Rivularia sp. MS3]
MLSTAPNYQITWEKLPENYVLDNVTNDINQPLLAAALTESLEVANKLPDNSLTSTNYGICTNVNQKVVVKAPDWAYIPKITVSRQEVKSSYTPQLQGDIPVIVMEFLSDTEGGEYSIKPTYPPGKWFFYEQVLEVPNYIIFEPDSGEIEVYQLDDSKRYHLQKSDANNRFWIAQMQLFLGVWQGSRENRSGYWLRWWDENGNLLLWGSEKAERLAAQLRAAGIEAEI